MHSGHATPKEFSDLRPRLRLLFELYRTADTEDARLTILKNFDETFLAAAWHVARDLLENGWEPVSVNARPHLKVVGGADWD